MPARLRRPACRISRSHATKHIQDRCGTFEKTTVKYQIEDTFKITGRGIVLTGIILSDEIFKAGDYIGFKFNGQDLQRKIIGLDSGMRIVKGKSYFGIMIETKSEKEIEDLRAWQPNKVIAEIINSNER